jgi:hypothetical protein
MISASLFLACAVIVFILSIVLEDGFVWFIAACLIVPFATLLFLAMLIA